MKLITKAISLTAAAAMFLSAAFYGTAPGGIDASSAAATETGAERYFYSQLGDESKVIYDAMQDMLDGGIFKADGDLELTGGDTPYITQKEAAGYLAGNKEPVVLLKDFGAARDAFYADHADVFYVDFSALSVRATTSADGYHIYLGKGRYDTYYTAGFENAQQVEAAIKEYDAVVSSVVAQANALKASDGENLEAKKVEFVHDYVTKHTSYRLEDVCKEENIALIRTSYGSLVRGEAVCEGYSRAVKDILDELGIPCVLVNGIYRHSGDAAELHMWNNVQIGGEWYGVDATMDDPINKKAASTDGVDGYESHEYLLVSEIKMSQHHAPSGVMSEAEYEFEYPMLGIEDFNTTTTEYDNGLVVTYNSDSELEGEKSGEYHISFRGMGYAKAAEQGYYMVCRFYSRDEETDEFSYTSWYYIMPEMYDDEGMKDSDTELVLLMPHIEYIEYGITETAPSGNLIQGVVPDSEFYGDPYQMVAVTGMLHNVSGTYKAPPYPKKSSPRVDGWLDAQASKPYHVEMTFDDILVETGEGVGLEMSVENKHHAVLNATYENFEFDGVDTISFDFKPDGSWAGDNTLYHFKLKGVVGKTSGKEPIEFIYGASFRCAVCAYRSQGYFWNVYAQPTLIENGDLSTEGWKTSDGEEVSEKLKHRMALVVSSPTHEQTDKMNDLISEKVGEGNLLDSKTFNIDLTVCKAQVVQTGQGVRVCMGFPDGYDADSLKEGTTFKVYHFMKDSTGQTIGVEEIPCVVTQYGLLVLCESFSPYAIAVVKDAGEQPAEKSVVMTATTGGSVSAKGTDNSELFALGDGESVEIVITADDGNVIDTVKSAFNYTVKSGKFGDKEMVIEVSGEDLADNGNVISVQFAAAAVKQAEAERGEQVIDIELIASGNEPEPEQPPKQEETEVTTARPEDPAETTTEKPKETTTEKPAETTPEVTTTPKVTTTPEVTTTAEKTEGTAPNDGSEVPPKTGDTAVRFAFAAAGMIFLAPVICGDRKKRRSVE